MSPDSLKNISLEITNKMTIPKDLLLDNCPLCGGNGVIEIREGWHSNGAKRKHEAAVGCLGSTLCLLSITNTNRKFKSMNTAIALWNARPEKEKLITDRDLTSYNSRYAEIGEATQYGIESIILTINTFLTLHDLRTEWTTFLKVFESYSNEQENMIKMSRMLQNKVINSDSLINISDLQDFKDKYGAQCNK